jgi:chaperonin cofactor prefoldin
VSVNQSKAIEDLNKDDDIQSKINSLNNKIREIKVETRELSEKIKDG